VNLYDPKRTSAEWTAACADAFAALAMSVAAYNEAPSGERREAVARAAKWIAVLFSDGDGDIVVVA